MVKKARPNLLRRLNERKVFELIRRRGPTSRADLRRRMGVSAPTVSKAVAHLLDAGLLEKVGLAPSRGVGRPVVVYRLAQGSARLVGASVGVQRCVIVSAGLDGIIDEEKTITFNTPRNYDGLIDAIVDATRKIVGRGGSTRGIGISVPGAVDTRQQRILLSPNLHFLNGQSPARDLRTRLGIETALVHDVAAACLAEQQYGAARDMSDFVLVGVYEGFGVAVVTGGRLIAGHSGLAGELGHVTVDLDGELCGCGNRGCLETVATDRAFAQAVSRRLGKDLSIEDIVTQSRAGAIDVREELERTLAYLSVGLAAAINLFNPEAIFLTSRLLDVAPGAYERLQAMTAARALKPLAEDCRIIRVAATPGRGAIAAILQHLTDALGPTFG